MLNIEEIQSIKVLITLQEDIAIDFVTGLLELKDLITGILFNAIFNTVNRYTKAAKFILFRNNYIAKQLAFIFNNYIVQYYRILKTIISNKDKLFILNF